MARNDEDTAFVYPDKYQDQVYEHDGQYIHFTGNSYTTLPKLIVDTVIEAKFDNAESATLDITDENSTKHITKLIEDAQANAFTNVNRVIENMGDKLGECLGLEDLQTFRDQVEVSINQLFAEKSEIAKDFNPEDILLELQRLDKKIDGVSGPMQPAPVSMETIHNLIKTIIAEELTVVHDSLPGIVNKLVKHIRGDVVEGKTIEVSATLSLGQLVTLKESGYTVAEIKELKDSGLI